MKNKLNKIIAEITTLFIIISSIVSVSYAYEIIYNQIDNTQGIDYGETKLIPFAINKINGYYIYEIYINGEKTNTNENLKVYLLGKNNQPLNTKFFYEDLTPIKYFINDKLYDGGEIKLMIQYYAPSTTTKINNIIINIYPYVVDETTSDAEIKPKLSPAISYNIKIYANAYLSTSSSTSGGSTTSYTTTSGSTGSTTYYEELQEDQQNIEIGDTENTTSILNESSGDYENDIENIEPLENNTSITTSNNSLVNNETNTLPTAKAVASLPENKSINYSTILIIIVGVLLLYAIWRFI